MLLLAVSGAAALVSPLWNTQPSLGPARLAGSVRLAPRSAAVAVVLRGGAARAPQVVASAAAEPELRPEQALKPTAFLFVLSVAVCALVPPAHLVATMGSAGATRLLSAVASISALMEILLAPLVGALSDSIGRKPVLMLTLLAVLVVNSAAACFPVVPLIVASTFVSKCVVGLFFLSSGASLGDAYRTDPAKLAGASGTLFAVVNAGFAMGIALSRFLPAQNTLRWAYGISAGMAAVATAVAGVAVGETMAPSQRVPFKLRKFNPVSCVRLFSSGVEMRLLALLLAITLQPIFMGDVLQVFAIGEWALSKGQVATFFTVIPVLGALGNLVGGKCVKYMGVQTFTALATLSNMLFWAGCCVSHNAALACAAIGFLGPARTLGASTALTTVGASKGIPQGQLSGDRSNLIAICKVIGPAVYGQLYVRGKAAGLPTLPFFLNIALTFTALLLAPRALRSVAARDKDGATD